MPTYQGTMPNNETPAVTCDIYMDGVIQPDISIVSIEDNMGALPSKCVIQFGNNGQDFVGAVTLNSSSWDFQEGSRVEARADDGTTLFLGSLQKRHDQGQTNKILWTALSDLELLAWIPLRGCLVANDTDGDVKLCTRYEPVMNPSGFWNCIGTVSVLDNETIVPVFASHAELGLKYQSPDLTVPVTLNEGQLVPWTPRLAMLYFQYLSKIAVTDAVQGIVAGEWRSLASSDRLQWDATSITTLVGYDVPTTSDPLDRKLPETDLRGMYMLGALDRVLQAAGTHDIQLNYIDQVSFLNFQPVSFSAYTSQGGNTPPVNLLRGGPANTTDTLYDFDLVDDATQVAEQVIIDGQPIHVEFSITNDATKPFSSAYAWRNAWTAQQEAAWLIGINGGYNQATRPFPLYAVYPTVQGTIGTLPSSNSSLGTWQLADGQSGRAYAEARSQAACDLLWASFPFVGRAFTIDSDALYASTPSVMAGYLSQYINDAKYPVLSYNRPCLPRQMQFYLTSPNGGEGITNWLKDTYPVRIRLADADGVYHEVPSATRIRVSPQGMIFIDGLNFEVNGKLECLYQGDLQIEPLGAFVDGSGNLVNSRWKKMVLNLVVPMDHRVVGQAIGDPTQSVFTDDYNAQLGGPRLLYVYSPNSYAETHQVNSQPGAEHSFYDGSSTTATPLNRFLPPGSERDYANYAAQRKLYQSRYPDRNGVFRLFGIRTDFKAGMWLSKIVMVNSPDPLASDYDVNAPIRSILWDFQPGSHSTTLGGVHNASTAYGGFRVPLGAMK